MLIQNLNKIIFIHGWLFGSYIWKEIQGRFPNVSTSELVSLPGYYKSSTHEHSHKVIDSLYILTDYFEQVCILSGAKSHGLSLYMIT